MGQDNGRCKTVLPEAMWTIERRKSFLRVERKEGKHYEIKEVNTYLVRPRWCFVEIVTDEGLCGWGEAVIEGKASTVKACVEEMTEYLIDVDPMRIEDIWNTLYRAGFYRGGPVIMSAISGIDQALWDIKGKYYNAPVYELMGGRCRDKMKVYSWIGGDRPSDVAAAALERKKCGI